MTREKMGGKESRKTGEGVRNILRDQERGGGKEGGRQEREKKGLRMKIAQRIFDYFDHYFLLLR